MRDGTSYERALRLTGKDAWKASQAEHTWIDKHYPGSKPADGSTSGHDVVVFSHRIEAHKNGIFSVHVIQLPSGELREVYFEQTFYFWRTKATVKRKR